MSQTHSDMLAAISALGTWSFTAAGHQSLCQVLKHQHDTGQGQVCQLQDEPCLAHLLNSEVAADAAMH